MLKTKGGTKRGECTLASRLSKGKGRTNEKSVEKEDDRKKNEKERLEGMDFSFFHIPKE